MLREPFRLRGESDDVVTENNVTPLVDVMLSSPVEPKRSVKLSVDARGKLYIDRAGVTKLSVVTANE